MKNKIFYIISTVALVVITSALSATYAYKYAKKESALDKDAAVKGIEFDMRERLSNEAISKAKEVIQNEKSSSKGLAKKSILEYFNSINGGNYEEAWGLLSKKEQKTYRSASALKNHYRNYKEIKVDTVEFRTSSPITETNAVKLSIVYKYPVKGSKNGSLYLYIKSINIDDSWLIDDISEE